MDVAGEATLPIYQAARLRVDALATLGLRTAFFTLCSEDGCSEQLSSAGQGYFPELQLGAQALWRFGGVAAIARLSLDGLVDFSAGPSGNDAPATSPIGVALDAVAGIAVDL